MAHDIDVEKIFHLAPQPPICYNQYVTMLFFFFFFFLCVRVGVRNKMQIRVFCDNVSRATGGIDRKKAFMTLFRDVVAGILSQGRKRHNDSLSFVHCRRTNGNCWWDRQVKFLKLVEVMGKPAE